MSFKTTALLLIVLIVIGAISWQMGVFGPKSDKPGAAPAPTVDAAKVFLIAPKLKDLTKVRLEPAGKTALVFEKKGDSWQIIDPFTAPAVGWELTDLVSGFEEARKVETFVPGEGSYDKFTLKDTGLDEPTYKITFEEKDRKLTYLVGKNAVASENTYVKTPDAKDVVLVDQNLRGKLKKNLADYRDKQLWELKRDKITDMEFVSRDGKVFKLTKGGDEKWVMASPIHAPVAADAINSAVTAVSSLRAEDFPEDKPKTLAVYGLDKPAWKITIVETEKVEPSPTPTPTTKSATPAPATQPTIKRTEHVILVGNPAGLKADQVFVKLADKIWVATLKDETLKKLIPDATAWRDKKVLDLDRAQIVKVQIQKGGRDINLAKADQAWQLDAEGTQTPADAKAVDGVLDTLTGLEAASFVDQPDKKFIAKNKLDYPVARIKLTATSSVDPIELTIGDTTPSGMFRYVKRSGRDYVAAVSNEKIAPLLQSYLAYYNRRVLEFNMDNVKTVEVTHNKQTYKVERADRNHPWKVVAPIAADADQDGVRDLITNLMTLSADEFVGKGNLDRYSLVKPQVLVKLVTEAQVTEPAAAPATQAATKPAAQTKTVRHEYALGVSKSDGKTYVARPDVTNPVIAQVSDKVYSDLTTELVDRRVFADLPTAKIGRLEIKKPGVDPLVFEKVNGEWKYPADPVVTIDKDKVEQIVSALAQVRAVRYAEFQPSRDYGLAKPHFVVTAAAGKTAYTLTAGQATGKDRYAQASNRPWVLVLSADDYAKLDKNLKDLLKQPSAAATPAAPPTD